MGWKLVGISAAVIVAMLAVVFAVHGWGGEGFAAAVRWTARTSFVLFLTAFSASSLRALWPSPGTRWLLSNRRYLGVSFAVSHLFHAAAIIGSIVTGDDTAGERTLAANVPGLVVYLFILSMLATSFDRTAAWVGPRVWRTLHTLGGYLVFFSFLNAYGQRALADPRHSVYVILLLAVLGLRIAKLGGGAQKRKV